MAGARHPRRPQEGATPGSQTTPALPARDARKAEEIPVKRRLTLVELLADADESQRLTRETMWLQELPAVGTETD